jgi:hypothetical protein
MKWDCGLSAVERYRASQVWHRWFAWWPTRIASHDCRWLETIERRLNTGRHPMYRSHWEYRPLNENL